MLRSKVPAAGLGAVMRTLGHSQAATLGPHDVRPVSQTQTCVVSHGVRRTLMA